MRPRPALLLGYGHPGPDLDVELRPVVSVAGEQLGQRLLDGEPAVLLRRATLRQRTIPLSGNMKESNQTEPPGNCFSAGLIRS